MNVNRMNVVPNSENAEAMRSVNSKDCSCDGVNLVVIVPSVGSCFERSEPYKRIKTALGMLQYDQVSTLTMEK